MTDLSIRNELAGDPPASNAINRRRFELLLVVALAASYAVLVSAETHTTLGSLLSFATWLVLLVYPLGENWRRQLKMPISEEPQLPLALALGLMAVAAVVASASIVLPRRGVIALLYLLIPAAWTVLTMGNTVRVRGLTKRTTLLLVLVVVLAATHVLLRPAKFSGVAPSGDFVVTGIGEDSMYLTIGQTIARTGRFEENPFYAGQPFVLHHFFSEYMVSSYLLTFDRTHDIFATRLLFHYALATPLLIALLLVTLRRLGASSLLAGTLTLCTVLPMTSYPIRGGWSGIEGMNGFWFFVHADLNYAFGLIAVLAVTSIVISAAEQNLTLGPLVAIQLAIACATQFKANFALAYFPASQLALILIPARRRDARRVILSACIGVAAIIAIFSIVLASTTAAKGHHFELEYGTVAMDNMLPLLKQDATDGIAPLVQSIERLPPAAKPIAVAYAYGLAYTPLFALAIFHSAILLSRRSKAAADVYLLVFYIFSLLAILFLIEVGPNKWNAALHLHYVIPLMGVFGGARLYALGNREARFAMMAIAWLFVAWSVIGLMTGARRFLPMFAGEYRVPDLIALCREIKQNSKADAIIVVANQRVTVSERYLALLTDRPLLVASTFAYNAAYPDAAAREKLLASVASDGPDVVRFARALGVSSIGRRSLIVIDRRDAVWQVPPTRCIGDYCYWEFDGLGTEPPTPGQTIGPGLWITPNYDPAVFSATSGRWIVDPGDISTFSYTMVGKTMIVSFIIDSTSVTAATLGLRISIPRGCKAARYTANQCLYNDNSSGFKPGYVRVYPRGEYVEFYKSDVVSNWSPSNDRTSVHGELTFEIQ